MKKIIINADDLGLSEGTNLGIVDALQNGLVSCTSLMACGPAFDHAVTLLKAHDIRQVGIHLALDEEQPLLQPDAVASLVGPDGKFLARGQLLKRLLIQRSIDLDEVKNEFRSQIQKCLDAGVSPTHLDGHGHVHVYPRINDVVISLAKEFGIQKVRLPAERFFYFDLPKFNLKKYINKLIVLAFARLSQRKFAAAGLRFPAGFMGMLFGGNLNRENLQKALAHLPNSPTVEIMAHPGDADERRDQRYAHWHYNWTGEYQALRGSTKKQLESELPVQIISFSDL